MRTKLPASLLLPFAALILSAPTVPADSQETPAKSKFAPKARPLAAYDHLNRKSPFEYDPPPVPTRNAVDPFEGVSLAGYCGSGKTLTVFLLTWGSEKKRITVYGDGSAFKKRDTSGYHVIGIKRGKTLKATAVILAKDGVQKEVTFEAETLRPKSGGPGGQQKGGMVPGPKGTRVLLPTNPQPAGSNQPWQAPLPFIPGQSNPAQPNQGNPALKNPGIPTPPVNYNLPNTNAQPAGGNAVPGLPVPNNGRHRRVVLPAVK